jgi:hypothetical protein
LSNVDEKTGIRYGVIHMNDLSSYAMDDIFTHGEDVGFEQMRQQAKDDLARAIASAIDDYGQIGDPDEVAAEIIDNAVEWHECDSSGPYEYDAEGVSIRTMSDNTELFVLKSPYYTHCQFCSPCAPGAGYLMNPCPDGPKTYCLGHDWFEDNKAPYPVYSVETGELV